MAKRASKASATSTGITIPCLPTIDGTNLKCTKKELVRVIRQRGNAAIEQYVNTRNAENQKRIEENERTKRELFATAKAALEKAGFTVGNGYKERSFPFFRAEVYSISVDGDNSPAYVFNPRHDQRGTYCQHPFWRETHENVLKLQKAITELDQAVMLAGATPEMQKSIADFFDGIKLG